MLDRVNLKDLFSGLFFVMTAAAFGLGATNYELGTAFNMGPAYLPKLMSGVLAFLGLAIILNSLRPAVAPIGALPPLRGIVFILSAPVVFALTVRELGSGPSVALVVLLGAFASRKTTVPAGLASAFIISAFCWFVFIFCLGLPLPVWGTWLR